MTLGLVRRWTAWIAWSALLVFATVVIGGAASARRRLPGFAPWHRLALRDFQASDLTAQTTLQDYHAIEVRLLLPGVFAPESPEAPAMPVSSRH